MTKNFEIGVIAKADATRRELRGSAYTAGRLDTAGDFMSRETLRNVAQAALRDGLFVDVEHDLKPLHKSHAAVVESSFNEATGSWDVAVKFSEAAWEQLVKSERVKGFSIYGKAEGRRDGIAKDESGADKSGKEILNPTVSILSLVSKPANRTQGPLPVAKSEVPAWAQTLIKQQQDIAAMIAATDKKLSDAEARLNSVSSGKASNVTALRKAQDEAEATTAVRITQLEKRHAALSARLERLWENPASAEGRSARAAENDLVIEIAKVETELEALRGERSFGASAFGGTSQRIDAGRLFVGDDSGLPQPNAKLKKAAEEIDLSCLLI